MLSLILALILFALSSMFKIRTTYKNMLCLAAIRSVILVPVAILASIIYLLSTVAAIYVFGVGCVIGGCFMMKAYYTTEMESDKIVWIINISMFIFILITLFVMYKGVVLYMPPAMSSSWGELSDAFSEISSMSKYLK